MISSSGALFFAFFGDENAVLHSHVPSCFRLDSYLCIGYVYSTAEVTQRPNQVLDILTRALFAMQLFQQRGA